MAGTDMDLGRLGAWIPQGDVTPELVAELEHLGYGAVWLGSSPGGDLEVAERLLAGTERIVVATGIVNVWKDDAGVVAAAHHRLTERYPGRFLLGIGIGHPEATAEYRRPLDVLTGYLDRLDEEGVPAGERVLAALGPKVLRLSAERSAGAHPYLVPPEHTRQARSILGPQALLAPEQKVVVESDPVRARAIGRPVVANPYLGMTNYVTNLRRAGFDDDDLSGQGSDRLIDALVAHGDAPTVVARLQEHLDAGADHVAIRLLSGETDPRAGYRAVAAAFPAP
jgi:probable F420-dependent oxidoreductase